MHLITFLPLIMRSFLTNNHVINNFILINVQLINYDTHTVVYHKQGHHNYYYYYYEHQIFLYSYLKDTSQDTCAL